MTTLSSLRCYLCHFSELTAQINLEPLPRITLGSCPVAWKYSLPWKGAWLLSHCEEAVIFPSRILPFSIPRASWQSKNYMESMQIVMLLRLFRIMSVLYIIAAKLESLNQWKYILLILLICCSCSPNLERSPYSSLTTFSLSQLSKWLLLIMFFKNCIICSYMYKPFIIL